MSNNKKQYKKPPYYKRTLLDSSDDHPDAVPAPPHPYPNRRHTLLDSPLDQNIRNNGYPDSSKASSAHTSAPIPPPQDSSNSIYANLLTFPEGTDHLKYFDANPHPEKIPADLLSIWNATPAPDLNPNLLKKQIEFNLVKDALMPKLSDMDKRLMRLPEKMQEWIDNATDEESLTMATHLRDSFYNYFSTPLDEDIQPDIQWIDYLFAIRHSGAPDVLKDLQANLFNSAAKKISRRNCARLELLGRRKETSISGMQILTTGLIFPINPGLLLTPMPILSKISQNSDCHPSIWH